MPFNTDPFGPYLLAGAQAGEQARMHKADLAALMQRFQQQQDFENQKFGFEKTKYENARQVAATALANKQVEEGISAAPLEATLAQPTHDWHVPEVMPGYDRPVLQMGKQGPTGVSTERVPRYQMPGQEAAGLIKSAVAAHYGGATNEQEAQAIIESKFRQQREKGYAGLRQGYVKQLADSDWLKARAAFGASRAQEKETAYKVWNDSLDYFHKVQSGEGAERAEYLKAGATDLPQDRKDYWSGLKKDAVLRLGQAGKEMKRLMGINVGYEEPITVAPPAPVPQDPQLLQPPSITDMAKRTSLGAALTEPGNLWPFGPGPASLEDARAAQKQLYPTIPEPPIFHQGKAPVPYKSSEATQPRGIRVPAAPKGPTLGNPGTGMGPQSAVPNAQGGITAGAPDLRQMVALLDKAMPWLSDRDMAKLVRGNMSYAA